MTMQEKTPERISWLDLTKGFAMILVLLGHSMRDEMRVVSPALDLIYRICYIFHMTCFFWIAGYTYRLTRDKGRQPLDAAGRRLKKQFPLWALYTLLIYVIFTVAIHLPGTGQILRSADFTAMTPGSYLLNVIRADNPWAYHLWFLYVLMLMTLLISLADHVFGGKRLKEVCCVLAVLGIAGMALRGQLNLGPWWRLYDYITLYLPVMCLGVLMTELRPSRTLSWLWGGIGILYIVIRAVFLSGFSGNSLRVESGSARFIIYLLADILLPGVILLLSRWFMMPGFRKDTRGTRFLRFLGKESLLIYLLHQPFCCAFLGLLLYNRLSLPALPVMGVCLFFSLSVSRIAVLVRDRIKKAIRRKKTGAGKTVQDKEY